MEDKTLEKVEQGVAAMLAKQAETDAKVAQFEARALAAEQKAEALDKALTDRMSEVQALMQVKGTPANEAAELVKGFQQFLHEAYMHKKFGKAMSEVHQKAVADFVTTVDATAGYLVPRIYSGLITEANEMYGALMPLLTNKVTVPAGVTMPVNSMSTRPSATWDLQGVAMDEAEYVYAQDTVTPKRLSLFVKASNEMLAAPATGFSTNLTNAFLKAIVKAKETAIFVGAAGDTTAPSDGILVKSGVSDQTNLASTIAALWTFIGESIVDNAELADMSNSVIFLTPAKYNTLVGTISGDASTGIATFVNGQFKVGGYPVYQHPATLISTTHWVTMFSPQDVVVADSGNIAFDFNPFGEGWTHNETWIRAVTHMDWSLGGSLAAKFSKADFS